MKEIDKKLKDTIHRYSGSGIEQQVDYDKFYLYSLITPPQPSRVLPLPRWKTNFCLMKELPPREEASWSR